MLYKLKKFVKSISVGIINMFKSEPVAATSTILSIPAVFTLAPKIAIILGINAILFCIALSLAIIPSVGRIVWNYSTSREV